MAHWGGVWSELAILWTMPYIVWFYMLLASFVMIFGNDNNKQICAGVVLLCLTLVVATALTMKLFIVVTLGILAYFLSKVQLPKSFTRFVILMAVGLALFTKLVRPSNAVEQSGWLQYFNLDTLKLIEGCVFAVLVSQIVHQVPKGRSLKIEQSAKLFAKFSYSMYLTHLIVINMLVWAGMPQYNRFTFESMTVYMGVVALCILFGYISYLLVEQHTGKIKKLLQ